MIRLALALILALATSAAAQTRQPSHCIAVADAAPRLEYLQHSSWSAPVEEHSVRIHYITHASFLIRTPGGLNAVTDYSGFIGDTAMVPDVVTMNHAHSTHWTTAPDNRIPHILPGWGETHGAGVDHYLDLDEMLVRNVSTDIRSAFGGREDEGNSIFVFEVAGLCVGHLGHLHHEPTDAQYAALGRLDVLMVPVDGGYTLPLDTVIRVVDRLRSSVVIPMHWFSDRALDRFLADVSDTFAVERRDGPSMDVSLRTLPSRPTVVVLRPEWLRGD
ncbi:MBL fold metallo-hydrolase [Citreimonas salinaria]|uniref:L-ascorbate metabolism protein UlaG, beta-lactamase superfamily n=1 Tax=Citreimonas salinaria TaxID=321339 RepID=A0A1H3MIE4_9RHOB|nr:MBL fold metallo-hydrolase [Citreimonas salinaria]SDY76487.1 L-ascorbate metabolism protein UlaG, beta-lactamase superfamily [Citreimonas salinaria]